MCNTWAQKTVHNCSSNVRVAVSTCVSRRNPSVLFPAVGVNGASPVLRRRRYTKKWRSLNGRAIIGANDPGDLLGTASLAVKQLTRVARWKDDQNCTVLKSRSSVGCDFPKKRGRRLFCRCATRGAKTAGVSGGRVAPSHPYVR